jgi:hypothetical protein
LGFEVVCEVTTGNTLHGNLQVAMKVSLLGVRLGGASPGWVGMVLKKAVLSQKK